MKRKIIFDIMIVLFAAVFSSASDLPTFGLQNISYGQSANFKQDELLVCFNDPAQGEQPASGPVIAGPRTRRSIRNIVSDYIVSGSVVDKEYDSVKEGLSVVKLPQGASVVDAFIKFNLSANVRYAEPNYKYSLLGSANSIAALINTYNAVQVSQTSEDTQTSKSEVTVAIADTGIDLQHPLLLQNLWVNKAELDGKPGVDDDGNGYIDDIYGYDFAGAAASNRTDGDSNPIDAHYHGTHLAGIINNIGNNSDANVKLNIMALKIFADDYLLEPSVFVSDAIEAIGYAANNGAKIINASWGGSTYSQALYDSIKDAGNKGLLVVAAAGNGYGNNNDLNPIYPAGFDLDNVISVMSVDEDNSISNFSNYGPSSVDIAAQGKNISSTTPTYLTTAMAADHISADEAILSGTSMSAANVSAQCAVIMAANQSYSAQSIKSLLLTNAEPLLASPRPNLSGGIASLQMALMGAPSTRSGKILNTRYSHTDTAHLYNSIQSAINGANDGDILIAESNKTYYETIDFKGKKITLRSGDITDPNNTEISPANTYITGENKPGTSVVTFHNNETSETILQGFTIGWGSATYGGGISCENSSPTILDCVITNNTAADYGGGIDCYYASPTIKNCTITNNTTSSFYSIGGGIFCENSSPEIINCNISYNFAENLGSAIACSYSNPNIANCLLTNNSSTFHVGNIYLEFSSPTISNCTIVTDAPNVVKDGGIHAFFDSKPVITNCVLWENGDELKNCIATFSCVQDGDIGLGNTKANPLFLEGPLGKYYLTQIAAGQLIDSPCVNTGNPTVNDFLQTSVYTTATDAITDEDPIDMGFHYPSMPAPLVYLTVEEVRMFDGIPFVITPEFEDEYSLGNIDPKSGSFRKQEVVQLTAIPDPNNKLNQWFGTDNDSSKDLINTVTMTGNKTVQAEFMVRPLYRLKTEVVGGQGTLDPLYKRGEYFREGTVITLTAKPEQNYIVDTWTGIDDPNLWSKTVTVTMNSDKVVTVSFRQPRTVYVPSIYQSISQAIGAVAKHGDKIVVSPGTYWTGSINFDGKAITLTSEHPDDPTCVATTIIDCQNSNSRAFIFENGEGNDSVINGFTIKNGDALWDWSTMPGNANQGESGSNAYGGAIACLNGSSPTLSNLIIENCLAHGQVGEPGTAAHQAFRNPRAFQTQDPEDQAPDPNEPESDPNDPNAVVDGIDGENGSAGVAGPNGVDGADGEAGYDGGNGGHAWGGALYFDANCSPILLNITIRDSNAIGGTAGRGGDGQDGQDGQNGGDGQAGQQGQNGGPGVGDDAATGNGGDGGRGGDGGKGGNAGNGARGGKGGIGGDALGGAIYFGPNCKPILRYVKIIGCSTEAGMGARGGDAGDGGDGGTGGAGGAGGAGGEGGADGQAGNGDANDPGTRGMGGNGGHGGNGGLTGYNGYYSVGPGIYFAENCEVEMYNCIYQNNHTYAIIDVNESYAGGDGGAGGAEGRVVIDPNAQPGDGGGDQEEEDPNLTAGIAGDGGDGNDGSPRGSGGAAGSRDASSGSIGGTVYSFTENYGGSNYYRPGCKSLIVGCTFDSCVSDGQYGGAEFYNSDCSSTVTDSVFTNNVVGAMGGAQAFDPSCTITISGTEYTGNFSGHVQHGEPTYDANNRLISDHTVWYTQCEGGALYWLDHCIAKIDNCTFRDQYVESYNYVEDPEYINNPSYIKGGAIYVGGVGTYSYSYEYIYDNLGNIIDIVSSTSVYQIINGGSLSLRNSEFTSNTVQRGYGGAMFMYAEGADILIDNCTFTENSSESGGALYWADGEPKISNCKITNNTAFGPKYTVLTPQLPIDINDPNTWYPDTFDPNDPNTYPVPGDANSLLNPPDKVEEFSSSTGGGGGLLCWGSGALIEDCVISDNESLGSGGAAYFGGAPSSPTMKNCLVTNNSALIDGGGIVTYWNSAPIIMNCTIADNVAFDPNREERGKGGGLSCSYESNTQLINSILWGNTARIGSQISIGSIYDPRYLEYPAALSVSYSDVQGGKEAADVETGRTLNWGNGNINIDPIFIDPYVLSQTGAGESINSPCVDTGSDISANFGLEIYSTRTDGGYDTGIVDMGYHSFNAVRYHLSANIPTGNGTIYPTNRMYIAGQIAHVVATPDNPNLFVRGWYNNGQLISTEKELDVVMNSDKNITVVFGTGILKQVTGGGNALSQAYAAASSGDTLVVRPGTYTGNITLKKDIRIISSNPDDSTIVSQTIISVNGGRAITISNNATANTVINGFTISGGGIYIGENCNPVLANLVINNASISNENGGGIFIGENSNPSISKISINSCRVINGNGGGIYISQGANPKLSDIEIYSCRATNGNAGGIYISSPYNKTITNIAISNCNASYSGGAVYCGTGTSPTFEGCKFINNTAGNSGGGIYYATSSAAKLNNSSLEENNSRNGAGIYASSNITSTLNNCLFSNNNASASGGGIYYSSGCISDINDCNFAGNEAAIIGGAIDYSQNCTINVGNSEFSNNTADMGGSIYFSANSSGTLNNSKLIGNEADSDGGAIYLIDSNNVSIADCNVSYNTANRGGAIFGLDSTESTITHCNLSFNDVTNVTTTIIYRIPDPDWVSPDPNDPNLVAPYIEISPDDPDFNPYDPNLRTEQVDTTSGTAQGGAIWSFFGPTTITDCRITNNIASTSGGGIYFYGNEFERTILHNCLIANNSSGRDGGAISNNWRNLLTVSNCTIVNNSATGIEGLSYGGGVYGSYESDTKIINSILWGNSSSFDGSQISLGCGDKAYPLPATMEITNSNLQPDPNRDSVTGPKKLDLVFVLDTTGSMSGYVNAMKEAATQITDLIAASIPDFRVASVEYQDFNDPNFSYGASTDAPWIDRGTFTNNISDAITGINSIGSGSGADGPESLLASIMHSIDHEKLIADLNNVYHGANPTDTGPGKWRTGGDVKRAIIVMTDAPAHHPEPFTNYENIDVINAAKDPSRPIQIFGIFNGGYDESARADLVEISEGTGGIMIEASEDADVASAFMSIINIIARIPPMIRIEPGLSLPGWDAENLKWDPNTHNINLDPNFTVDYYLSQIASGQKYNSPCVDAGSGDANDPNIALGEYTTRMDGVTDTGLVDMGYHHSQGLPKHNLIINIEGSGTVEPQNTEYYEGETAHIVAIPGPNMATRGWYMNGELVSYSETLNIVMDANKTATVVFGQGVQIDVHGGGDALQRAVKKSLGGDTVIVQPGTYSGGIELEGKNIRIVSTNPDDPSIVSQTIIDASSGVRAITIDNGASANTLIDGLTIINANVSGEPGGAIFIGPDCSPTIANLIIRNCRVTDAEGGAIYASERSKPIITNVKISNCEASSGDAGAIYIGAKAIAILTDVSIDNCSTTNGGGAIYCDISSSTILNNCILTKNSAVKFGGGICYDISSSTILNNCEITDNTAEYGAGIYEHNNSESIINKCNIKNNHATTRVRATGSGGGIFFDRGNISEITDSNITDNTAVMDGGAIYYTNTCTFTITNSNLTNNTALNGAGIYFNANSSGTITGSKLSNNTADEDGGAIYLIDSNDVSIVECNMENNTSRRGGAVFSMYSPGSEIVESDFSSNKALNVITVTTYRIPDPNWVPDPNDPNAVAPLIPILPTDPNFDPNDPNLVTNTSEETSGIAQGGAFWSFAGPTNITNCLITGNESSTSGGGIYISGNNIERTIILNCLFENNTAGRDGGAISNNWYNLLTVSNCTIVNNTADGAGELSYGGGIYGSYESNTKVINSILWGNITGFDGSQIAVGSGDKAYPLPSTFEIKNCDIQPDPNGDVGPQKLDLVFVLDTTGSMGSYINAMKDAATQITNRIKTTIPDFRIASVEYQDFNDPNFSYGASTDAPWIDRGIFTNNVTEAIAGINAIGSGSGADGPEALLASLMHTIDHEKLIEDLNNVYHGANPADKGPGQWRTGGDVKRVIIVMTDAPAHHPEPFTNYENIDVINAAKDPSRPIQIFGIFNGGYDETTRADLVDLSEGTGGVMIEATGGSDVPGAIMEVINIISRIPPMIRVEQNCNIIGWDAETMTWDASSGNIAEDPLFVDGFLLSQIAASQDADSPAVDSGSVNADDVFESNIYTTTTGGFYDTGIVDMGYHYKLSEFIPLTVNIVNASGEIVSPEEGHGYIKPTVGSYPKGTVVTLTAYPDPNYRVVEWTGTDNVSTRNVSNTVTLSEAKTVTIRFEEIPQYTLNVQVQGSGTVVPSSGIYREGDVVHLVATPNNPNLFVRGWYDNGILISLTNELDLVMNSNKNIRVVFGLPQQIQVEGGQSSLQNAINSAKNGDTIIIGTGTYTGPIDTLGKELRIISSNPEDPDVRAATIIDAGNKGRAFTFNHNESSRTVLDGFTIINGNSSNQPGGAIYIGSGCSPILANLVISNCSSGNASGGAIYVESGSVPTLRSISIANCSGSNGGAIYFASNSNPTMTKIEITSCRASAGNAGGLYIGSNINKTFVNISISKCTASGSGGAIYCSADSSPIFTKCTLSDNSAGSNGGGIYYNQGCFANVNQSEISGNRAQTGAGIYLNTGVSSKFDHCTFTENNASNTGSAIYNANLCDSEVKNCSFTNNKCSEYGGAILFGNSNSVTIADSNFVNNSAKYGGAVYLNADCQGSITNSNMVENDANQYGGAIYQIDSDDFMVEDCNISYNTALFGGGLYCYETQKTVINNCIINYNEAVGISYITRYSIPNPNYDPNGYDPNSYDPNDPNTAYDPANDKEYLPISPSDPNFDPNDPNLVITRTEDRSATARGAGIYAWSGPMFITDTQLRYNKANTAGGGIYLAYGEDYTTTIDNCLIVNNSAIRDGGGISSNWQNNLIISNCTVAENTAAGIGGGLSVSYESYAEVINSIIWRNVGSQGAQISSISGDQAYTLPSNVDITYSVIGPYFEGEPNQAGVGFNPTGFAEGLTIQRFTDPAELVNAILGKGIIASNVKYTGDPNASGLFTGGVAAGLGIEAGVILTSGDANNAPGTDPNNKWTNYSDGASSGTGEPGDSDLESLISDTTNDAAVLEFDFVSKGGDIFFSYVFASEEYNEFVYSFNDVFAFFVDGENIAFIPGTSTPVSVDNINGGNPFGSDNATNPELYHNNDPSDTAEEERYPFEYDGFTVVLTAQKLNLGPGTHHIKLAIADALDSALDSAVFLQYGSFSDARPFYPPVYVENGCTITGWEPNEPNNPWSWTPESWAVDTHIIGEDPNFATDYYLSHIATGQEIDSVCIDAGSGDANDPDIAMALYTTRMDGVVDAGIVDMGYHYSEGLPKYTLDVTTNGHGTIDPNGGTYYGGTLVTLTATPENNYRVQGWYDENKSLLSTDRTFNVVMDANKVINVIFELGRTTNVSGGGDALITAIGNAKEGDILVVGSGTYAGNITMGDKELTIVSTNPDDPDVVAGTIIDCNSDTRGITINGVGDREIVINGLTITNCDSNDQPGGGIYIGMNSKVTLQNLIISNCSSLTNGGGIYVSNVASPKFINCTITDCTSGGYGGAVCLGTGSVSTFNGCTFMNCTSDSGAGVYFIASSTGTFEGCAFSTNIAASDGGGLYTSSSCNIDITDCNLASNEAIRGGGFFASQNTSLTLSDSIIQSNTAILDGGAGYWNAANVELNNCNIRMNTAVRGGGLWLIDTNSSVISGCSIFYNIASPIFDTNDANDPNTAVVTDPNALITGQGGAIYAFKANALITDNKIRNNIAYTSGGGIYTAGDANSLLILNNLIESNLAGRDGGGISANWQSSPLISSCTFVSNTAPGIYANANGKGYGGALYCSYQSVCTVTNSIFWNNSASNGPEIAIGTGFEYDPRPSTLYISYSDIKPSGSAIWVDTGCKLNPGVVDAHNIDKNPLFVISPSGNYYLSQTISGQFQNSPCIDAGSDDLNMLGVARFVYTTRTDEGPDMGKLDIGFHYPSAQPDKIFDIHTNGTIDINDVKDFNDILAAGETCTAANNWCHGADFNYDGKVDANDVAFMNAYMWLGVEDDMAPNPNPSLWDAKPYMIGTTASMSAQEALDSWFDYWDKDVEYYFDCVYGNCDDSGWITNRSYTDSGLDLNTQFAYRVRARDAFPGIPDDGTGEPGNKTEWSSTVYVGGADTTPPAPVPAIISFTSDTNSISLVASVAYDESGFVEYYFESVSTSLGGKSSGWISDPNYTDPNLTPNTEYGYRVKARDKYGKETIYSDIVYIYTAEPEDKTPPTPNPMTWDDAADMNGVPYEVVNEDYTSYVNITMTATAATDDSGGTVYYLFECDQEDDFSSSWITENTFTVGPVGRTGLLLRFRVWVKDGYGNITAPSAWTTAIPLSLLPDTDTDTDTTDDTTE